MDQKITHDSLHEDEIDLKEIFKLLIESKKLIILTILVFTIAFYLTYKTFKDD